MNAPLKMHVLLVEDSPTDTLLARDALERGRRFDVTAVERLHEASQLLDRGPAFDVVLLDLGLPDSQGIDTLVALRRSSNQVPVVVMTGQDDEELALQALHHGAQDYLVKGHVQQDIYDILARAIRYAIERHRVEQLLLEKTRVSVLSADIGRALIQSRTLPQMLKTCAESLVSNLGVALARIWTVDTSGKLLELQSSAGLYTHTDGPHSRIAVGDLKVGAIARDRKAHLTNDIANDPRITDRDWARREGLQAFAGYPLVVGERLVGVLGMFARRPLSSTTLDGMAAVANQIALGIERMSAEQSLHESNETLEKVVHLAPLAIVVLDKDEKVRVWNAAAERLFGWTQAEVMQQRSPAIPGDRGEEMRAIHAREQAGLTIANLQTQRVRRDGTRLDILFSSAALRDARSGFAGSIRILADISEQKRLEQKIRETQERLQHVLASSPAVLFTLGVRDDQIQGITWISDNVRHMLGYPPEAAGTDWWRDNVHPEDRDRIMAEAFPDLLDREFTSHEYRFRHGDGTYRWTRGELRLVRDASGRPTEVVGAWSDITERKTLEDQYRQAQKMEAVGRLAGGVAHDFNNLLTVINGYSEVLISRMSPQDPVRDIMKEINTSGERAAALTAQLLAFSRKQILVPVVLNVNSVIADVAKMLRRLIGEDIDLLTTMDPTLWLVRADPGQLQQVLMNLAINARDAMPNGGKLTIETRNIELDGTYMAQHPCTDSGKFVMIAVSDNGHGMDAATRSRIFEPFFTTKGPERGTGLGLATVYGIVKQSGGNIEVYSEPGRGTTFKVYLPRAPEAAERPKSDPVQRRQTGTETILLVEDDTAVRALSRLILAEHGFHVLPAADAEEALRISEDFKEPIHILVTDVVMPKRSGPELAVILAKTRPDMRQLFLSGYTDDAIVHHGILNADMPFLQKPFRPEVLVNKVREVLDQ